MKHITIGTAGHIDHGKTALVKALTGMDTDRLPEEKQRGISIELGFAYLEFPEGIVDIVDVPGHEKFIKTMVAGVAGIDAVMLVVAGDERIKPQTREHLDIVSVLGVHEGFVALTKSDLVEPSQQKQAEGEIKAFLSGTLLQNAPLFWTSSVTGEGVEELKQKLKQLFTVLPRRPVSSYFYLPVDRSFTMKGFGTVVTGTLQKGIVKVGDKVQIEPSGKTVSVKGLQVHNRKVEEAEPGWRAALNLSGADTEEVRRGSVISPPGHLKPTYFLDAKLSLLKNAEKPLMQRQRVRFHFGTREVFARVVLLDRGKLLPGEEGFVQFQCDRKEEDGSPVPPVAAVPRQPFVIRTYSPMQTIGGGHISDPFPEKHKPFQEKQSEANKSILSRLTIYTLGQPKEIFLEKLKARKFSPVYFKALAMETELSPEERDNVEKNPSCVFADANTVMHRELYDALKQQILKKVSGFHEKAPLKPGMFREELRQKLPRELAPVFFQKILTELAQEGKIQTLKERIKMAGFAAALPEPERKIEREMVQACLKSLFSPPTEKELVGLNPERMKVFQFLKDNSVLVLLSDGVVFHRDAVEKAKQLFTEYFQKNNNLAVGQAKDILKTTRKYIIPLLEHLDSSGFTRRVGDVRVLREK